MCRYSYLLDSWLFYSCYFIIAVVSHRVILLGHCVLSIYTHTHTHTYPVDRTAYNAHLNQIIVELVGRFSFLFLGVGKSHVMYVWFLFLHVALFSIYVHAGTVFKVFVVVSNLVRSFPAAGVDGKRKQNSHQTTCGEFYLILSMNRLDVCICKRLQNVHAASPYIAYSHLPSWDMIQANV